MSNRILWAGRTLHGVDECGTWRTTRDLFEGWYDSPEIKGETVAHDDADGDYDLPIYNEARLITVGGTLRATNRADLLSGRNKLAGRMAGRLQVEDTQGILWAEAKRNSKLRFVLVNDNLANWQVRLKCVDPRKFGDTRTWSGSVGSNAANIFHRGNYNATPQFVVSGSMPGGYTLTIRGQVFNVTAPLVSGHPHSIDYGTGRLRIDGAIVHGGLGWGFTPLVPPGVITALSIEPITTGTATAQLTLLDTYI